MWKQWKEVKAASPSIKQRSLGSGRKVALNFVYDARGWTRWPLGSFPALCFSLQSVITNRNELVSIWKSQNSNHICHSKPLCTSLANTKILKYVDGASVMDIMNWTLPVTGVGKWLWWCNYVSFKSSGMDKESPARKDLIVVVKTGPLAFCPCCREKKEQFGKEQPHFLVFILFMFFLFFVFVFFLRLLHKLWVMLWVLTEERWDKWISKHLKW